MGGKAWAPPALAKNKSQPSGEPFFRHALPTAAHGLDMAGGGDRAGILHEGELGLAFANPQLLNQGVEARPLPLETGFLARAGADQNADDRQ